LFGLANEYPATVLDQSPEFWYPFMISSSPLDAAVAEQLNAVLVAVPK
jgi:hypothetical protein